MTNTHNFTKIFMVAKHFYTLFGSVFCVKVNLIVTLYVSICLVSYMLMKWLLKPLTRLKIPKTDTDTLITLIKEIQYALSILTYNVWMRFLSFLKSKININKNYLLVKLLVKMIHQIKKQKNKIKIGKCIRKLFLKKELI